MQMLEKNKQETPSLKRKYKQLMGALLAATVLFRSDPSSAQEIRFSGMDMFDETAIFSDGNKRTAPKLNLIKLAKAQILRNLQHSLKNMQDKMRSFILASNSSTSVNQFIDLYLEQKGKSESANKDDLLKLAQIFLENFDKKIFQGKNLDTDFYIYLLAFSLQKENAQIRLGDFLNVINEKAGEKASLGDVKAFYVLIEALAINSDKLSDSNTNIVFQYLSNLAQRLHKTLVLDEESTSLIPNFYKASLIAVLSAEKSVDMVSMQGGYDLLSGLKLILLQDFLSNLDKKIKFQILQDADWLVSVLNKLMDFEQVSTMLREFVSVAEEKEFHALLKSAVKQEESVFWMTQLVQIVKSLGKENPFIYGLKNLDEQLQKKVLSSFGAGFLFKDENLEIVRQAVPEFEKLIKQFSDDEKIVFWPNYILQEDIAKFLLKEKENSALHESVDAKVVAEAASLLSNQKDYVLGKQASYIKKIWGEEFYKDVLKLTLSKNPEDLTIFIEDESVPEKIKLELIGALVEASKDMYFKDKLPYQMYNKWIRAINALHLAKYTKFRGEIIKNMGPAHRFYLAAGGLSEMFTSTSTYANYLLPAIAQDIQKAGSITAYLKLTKGKGEFTSLIHAFSRYGKLDEFLRISNAQAASLIKEILESKYGTAAEQVQSVLEMIDYYYKNKNFDELRKIEELLFNLRKNEYAKTTQIIASLYLTRYKKLASANPKVKNWFLESYEKEKIQFPDTIEFDQLYSKEGNEYVHRQIWFFFEGGDKDGIKSRWSAISRLKSAGFVLRELNGNKTQNDKIYIFTLQKDNKKVEIILSPIINVRLLENEEYINKISKYIIPFSKNTHLISYRGHSTYVPDFSYSLPKFLGKKVEAQMVYLGSCGGVLSIEKLSYAFEDMPNYWFATEAVGSTSVNDPLLAQLAKHILNIKHNEKFSFKEFKNKLPSYLLSNPKFQSYKLPHENLAAIILKHY